MRKTASVTLQQNGPMAAGWFLSCLLHGGLMIATLLFMQRIQLFPETELFQWSVAMVGAPSPSTLSPSPATSTVPSSIPKRSTPSVGKPVRSRAETQAPVPQSALSRQSIDQAITQRDIPTPSAIESAPPSHDISPPPVEPSTQLRSASEPLQPIPDSSSLRQTDSETVPSSSIASIPPTFPSLDGMPSTQVRSDYGWLAELMAQWIKDLDKRYPATLRAEGIQGKVTLTAILHEDGLLSDVRVVKSSGSAALDQVALEDVSNGTQIKLSRPLERHQMPVKFSISYDLKTAR